MRPFFYPRLVNGPFDDPGLFIPFQFETRAILFDIGDLGPLSPRDILKVSHVFVSHTHMDHFIGFDRLLRLFIGRDKSLSIYGPEGFIKNAEGKLAGYSWNLVENYDNRFELNVYEIRDGGIRHQKYACSDRFLPKTNPQEYPFDPVVVHEPAFDISVLIMKHGIPCLGFSIKEHFHVNIKKDALTKLGIEVGPWLAKFKRLLYQAHGTDTHHTIKTDDGRSFSVISLAEKIAVITPGQKITYIADVGYDESGAQNIIEFAKDSDYLFIEAAFLEKDREIAEKKHHLTARQSGEIAGRSRTKVFQVFHFSPRYIGMEDELYREARAAYEAALTTGEEASL